jgi:hypothetical protein
MATVNALVKGMAQSQREHDLREKQVEAGEKWQRAREQVRRKVRGDGSVEPSADAPSKETAAAAAAAAAASEDGDGDVDDTMGALPRGNIKGVHWASARILALDDKVPGWWTFPSQKGQGEERFRVQGLGFAVQGLELQVRTRREMGGARLAPRTSWVTRRHPARTLIPRTPVLQPQRLAKQFSDSRGVSPAPWIRGG